MKFIAKSAFVLFSSTFVLGAEPKVSSIWQQPSGATPRILALKDKLLVLNNTQHSLRIFDLQSKSSLTELKIGSLATSITTDGTRVAFCDSIGAQINLFDLTTPEKTQKISLLPPPVDDEQEESETNKETASTSDGYKRSRHLYDINCSDLQFERDHLWISSPGSQEVVKLSLRSKRISKAIRVSGSTNLTKVGKNIFTLNNIVVMSDAAVPYIMDEKGKTLVGDPMGSGQNTSLTRGYAPLVFADQPSQLVFYAKTRERILHAFSMSSPSEKTMQEIPVSVGRVRSLARIGSCLLVAGQNDEVESAMEFSLLRLNAKSADEVWYSGMLQLEGMAGLREVQVSADSRVLASDWVGVHEIENLIPKELCQ